MMMMDFNTSELGLRVVSAERGREADAIAARRQVNKDLPVGLRASVAVKLAKLALAVDHDAAEPVIHRHLHIAGRGF